MCLLGSGVQELFIANCSYLRFADEQLDDRLMESSFAQQQFEEERRLVVPVITVLARVLCGCVCM